jgi:hypothetical protein
MGIDHHCDITFGVLATATLLFAWWACWPKPAPTEEWQADEVALTTAQEPRIDVLAYLWHQYEYRHDMCWRTAYKVTFAVVTLAIVPYVKSDLIRQLECGALVPPFIALCLAVLGYRFANNELHLFGKTKIAYYHIQDRWWNDVIAQPKIRSELKRRLDPDKADQTAFDDFVRSYLGALIVLGAGNAVFVWCRWIPRVLDP